MPFSYTNRKGKEYYLCEGKTKTGKVRYYFSRQPMEDAPDQIPDGYRVSESVNGIVSLVKIRPQIIFEQEVSIVEEIIELHSMGNDYRVAVKDQQIVIYERQGPDVANIVEIFSKVSLLPDDILEKRVQEQQNKTARFSPVMRFILVDREKRKFTAERWCYLGGNDDWINIRGSGELEYLASELIPQLGTDDFYDLI